MTNNSSNTYIIKNKSIASVIEVYKLIIRGDFNDIQMFHTDRGSEFKNELIDEMLNVFQIKRFLSRKGCSYNNAVAESNFKMFKTEFVKGRNFESLEQLKMKLANYVHWFNNIRIHGSLNYMTPVEYRKQTL